MSEPHLAALLARFVSRVEAVWDAYRAAGPGRVGSELYAPVETASAALEAALGAGEPDPILESVRVARDLAEPDPILESVRVARDLAERCACTSLGLSFISGEAGLIPRKDQHDALEHALAALRARAAVPGGAGAG